MFPVLGNPANDKQESNALHAKYTIPAPGHPLFEAAFANFNSKTEPRVDTLPPNRGPLRIIGGGKERTDSHRPADRMASPGGALDRLTTGATVSAPKPLATT